MPYLRTRGLQIVLGLATSLAAWTVLAQDAPTTTTVHVIVARVDACVPVDPARFRQLLSIELGAEVEPAVGMRAEAMATVTVQCGDRGSFELRLDDSVTNKTITRKLGVDSSEPEAQARLMALAAAELLLASWLELQLLEQAEPAGAAIRRSAIERRAAEVVGARLGRRRAAQRVPGAPTEPSSDGGPSRAATQAEASPPATGTTIVGARPLAQPEAAAPAEPATRPARAATATPGELGPPAAPPDAEPTAAAARSLQLGAAAEALAFSSAFSPIPSLGIRLTLPVTASLASRIGVQVGHSSLDGDLGATDRPAAVDATLASLLAMVLHRSRFDSLELAVGLGGRLGLASLSGERSADPTLVGVQSFAAWAGPLLAASAGYRTGDHLQLTLGLEIGYATLRARALGPEGRVVAELRDLWGGVSFGIDWSM